MDVIAADSTSGPILVVLVAMAAVGAAGAPLVAGFRERRAREAIAGGVLGVVSVCWLLLAFMTEAFCDGTCGRDATALYVAGGVGLVACLLFAATLVRRVSPAVTWSLLVAGAVALGIGLTRW